MKNHIGLIASIILITLSIIIFKGTGRYIGSFVGIFIGILISTILHGVATQNYKSSIITTILIAFSGALVLFFFVTIGYLFLVEIHDYFAIEHSLDLQLHGSYTIDTSEIKKITETKENASFAYVLQLRTGNKTSDIHYRNDILKSYGLDLPDELLDVIAASAENSYVILAFGRELEEVKYKFLGYFSDGVTAKAKVIFHEKYLDNIVYAYFIKKHVYFWDASFYEVHGKENVLLERNLLLY